MRTPTGGTLFNLTYGVEAVIPVEVGLTSFRREFFDEQELHLSFSLWQGAHNVDPPLCERPGRGNTRHLFTWNSLDVPVSLAATTFPHEFCCVLLHRGPEIARPHDLPDQ